MTSPRVGSLMSYGLRPPKSSGSISLWTNSSIQSSSFWNSGSVSKSQDMGPPLLDEAEDATGVQCVGVLDHAGHLAVATGVDPAVLVDVLRALQGGGGEPQLH